MLDILIAFAFVLQYSKEDVFGRESAIVCLHLIDEGQVFHLVILQEVDKVVLVPADCCATGLYGLAQLTPLGQYAGVSAGQVADLTM